MSPDSLKPSTLSVNDLSFNLRNPFPDPQKDLKIKSPRTIGEII